MKIVDVVCACCGVSYTRPKNRFDEAVRNGWDQFCSRECQGKAKSTSEIVPCAECGEPVKVSRALKARLPDSNRFCSQHCGAVFNNRNRPPRSVESREKVSQTLLAKSGNSRKPCPQCGTLTLKKHCSLACYAAIRTVYETPESVVAYIQQQTLVLGTSPSSKVSRPAKSAAKRHFGSWNKAVKAAGCVPNTQWMARKRIPCKDGHVADSVSERTLDDWFHDHGIRHEPHKRYPDDRRSCDFYLPDLNLWVEYFGMLGNKRYELEMDRKLRFAEDSGLVLIPILPEHLYPNLDQDFFSHTFCKILAVGS